MEEKNLNLPTVQELEIAPAEAFKQDQLKSILNQQPPKKWVKKHPFAKCNYVAIDKVEFTLDRIFQQWRVEVIDYKQLFNSVSCHVRLHYLNPASGEWQFHDGLGAVGIQTDKGKSASNLDAIKQSAVMMALPSAKSYAIKDAAEHLGDLFGRNLNRKDTIAFSTTREVIDYTLETLEEIYNSNGKELAPEDDMNIQRIIETKEETSYKKAIDLLKKLELCQE